jgi:hypothetical protein
MVRSAAAAGIAAAMLCWPALAQERSSPPSPTVPGSAAITWNRMLQMSDGRTFVSDGGIIIDAAVAQLDKLPDVVLSPSTAKGIESRMAEDRRESVRLSQLSQKDGGRYYLTPSGLALNGTYVAFLRDRLSEAETSLRPKGDLDPVVVVRGRQTIGLMMPMRRPSD